MSRDAHTATTPHLRPSSCRYSIVFIFFIMQVQTAKPQVAHKFYGPKINLICTLARYHSQSESSNCANIAEGRNGMHHISEVSQIPPGN